MLDRNVSLDPAFGMLGEELEVLNGRRGEQTASRERRRRGVILRRSSVLTLVDLSVCSG